MSYAEIIQLASAGFSIAAAVFWILSSRVKFPEFRGQSGGEAGIHALGNAAIRQSKLSKRAALCAGAASFLIAAYLIFTVGR